MVLSLRLQERYPEATDAALAALDMDPANLPGRRTPSPAGQADRG
jgi:hypothetical protein